MTKFEMLFDNGGGILLLTDSYCHSYNRPTWAADDAAKLLDGEITENWDGNQPEYRRERHAEDDLISHNTARNIYEGNMYESSGGILLLTGGSYPLAWEERGAAWNEFCRELARIGAENRGA